jgi:succinate-semialdehyde dehydrogenase / glutarate-semialdehyde dehydrogenase
MIRSPLLRLALGRIGGVWTAADHGGELPVINPATGEVLAQVPAMGKAETARAIDAAQHCLAEPASLTQRRKWLRDIAAHLLDEREELGRIVTLEQGKPLTEAMAEIDQAAGFFSYYANHLDQINPRELPERARRCEWSVHARPVGVVGLITPWTCPVALLARKLAPAIAAGCPVVARPSSRTPLSAIALLHLLDERLDLPAGSLNLVTGVAEPIVDTLCAHPAVRAISFTGSTQVGRTLIVKCAPGFKRLSLALSGNTPFIVCEDADLELAADQLMRNKFKASGQDCTCANRVLVHQRVIDAFTDLVVARVGALRMGNGLAAETTIGPLIDQRAHDRLSRQLTDALDRGARLLAGGLPSTQPADSHYFPPTVLREASPDMACWREESLGPLLPITGFSDSDQALALANDTEHGLAAYLFTADGDRAERMLRGLAFGHVGHNAAIGSTPEAPFGGIGHAGLGREGGPEGLLEFVEQQTVARGP